MPVSSLHSKRDPLSLEAKMKLAIVEVVIAAGPSVIQVSGGVVSAGAAIVQVQVAGVGSMFPAASTALTSKLCAPTAKAWYVLGDSQGTKFVWSMEHRKPARSGGDGDEPKVKVAEVAVMIVGGPSESWVSGALSLSSSQCAPELPVEASAIEPPPIGMSLFARSSTT